jgi:APA family basic amino acid/polyamine antiporter
VRLPDPGPGGEPAGPPAPGLRRALGVWQVSLAGIGVILGAGVYALVGAAARHAGSALWAAFVLAAVAAGLTAYSYARLGSMRPKDSPEFQYTSLAFGPRVGFVAGWLMLVADLLAVAAVALGFGGYLAHLAGTSVVAGALALLAVSAAVALAGIGQSVTLAIALTVLEAAGLLVVGAAGAPAWGQASYTDAPAGWSGVSAAAALIFFAYLGFDDIGNLAEEMRRPERDLPRALLLSLAAASVIYLVVALSATALVDWRELAGSTAPLALVAGRAFGPRADTALTVIGLAATSNTVLLLMVAAARSIYGMAAAGALPRALARVGRRAVPLPATIAVVAVTGLLILPGNLARAAAMTDAAVLLSFLLVNLSLPWLARQGRTGGGAARRTVDRVVPALAVALCGWLLLHTGWESLIVTALLALSGIALAGRAGRAADGGGPSAGAAPGTGHRSSLR